MGKTIGFIGYKGHALRLMKIFAAIKGCEVSVIFHPQKSIDLKQAGIELTGHVKMTNNLKDLNVCDAIVIASPNATHFRYLKELSQSYSGYIFCEKPPVANLKELELLEQFPEDFKRRLYFNFNLRTSWLFDELSALPSKFDLGEPVRASVVVGYGFAFKEAYRTSWRSTKEFHATGVLETLGIHYLDLLSRLLGRPGQSSISVHKFSPHGEAMDTCHLSCVLGEKCFLNISCSYAIPFTNQLELHYTNGIVQFDNGDLRVLSPRDSFDAAGAFISPPVKYQASMPGPQLYSESLARSCRFFTGHVDSRSSFAQTDFEQSILSNRICLLSGQGHEKS